MPDKEIPPIITIPLPTEIPHSYGVEATSGPNGCFIQCRGTEYEREKIKLAAASIGLSYGTFMRRIVNDVADFIIRELQLTYPPILEQTEEVPPEPVQE